MAIYETAEALKAAILARIKNNGVGGKVRASDIEEAINDVADSAFAQIDEKTTDITALEDEIESIKRPSEISFSEAIPFTLPSAKTSITVIQDYALSLGVDAVADSFHTIVSTGNQVNTISFPSVWINGNGGVFDNTKIQRIILYFDGDYVTYTITDLADAPVIDLTKPTVTISSTESGTTSVNPIPLAFTLSEASTDFVVGDAVVTNGTLSNFAGSGVNYTADLVPTGEGPITVNILADSFTDEAGNGNNAATEFSITYEEAVSYPAWVNTQSMVVDAQGEGIEVVDNSLYPLSQPFTWELIYKTPSSFKISQPIKLTDDTGAGLVSIATDISGNFYLQLLTNSTNKLIFSQTTGFPVVNTFYHIVVTSTGGASPVVTMKLNNVSVNPNGVETGDYTGLPALTGNCKVQIPNYGNASYGAGSYNLFRIFNKVLTDAEITALYTARVSGGLTGLNELIEACLLELRFEGNANAAIGTNGTVQATPTYAAQTP